MFQSQTKKIRKYIEDRITGGVLTPFDELLRDFLSGDLKSTMLKYNVQKISIHIDWLSNYKCIGIQGTHHSNYLDLQIMPGEFSIGYDPDEPDDHCYRPLESREQFYSVVQQTLSMRM